MQINLTNLLTTNLSLELVFESGPGPHGRVVREYLAPGESVDIGAIATLAEANMNANLQALITDGIVSVDVLEESGEILSADSQFNKLRNDAANGLAPRRRFVSVPVTAPTAATTVVTSVMACASVERVVSARIAFQTLPASAAGTILATLARRTGAGAESVISSGASVDLEALVLAANTAYGIPLSATLENRATAVDDIVYLTIVANNGDATPGSGGILTLELEEVSSVKPFHKANPSAIGAAVSPNAAVTLATVMTLANELKGLLNLHFASEGDAGAHLAASVEVIAAADATDQGTSNTLLNELKDEYNSHLIEEGVHVNSGALSNVVVAADATNLATSITLANAIKSAYNVHIASCMDSLPMGSN